MAVPSLVTTLLLGAGLDPAGAAIGRFGGVALLCLGLACWPAGGTGAPAPAPQRVMLVFQIVVAGCLVLAATVGGFVGSLIWPAIGYHAAAAIILARCSAPGPRRSAG